MALDMFCNIVLEWWAFNYINFNVLVVYINHFYLHSQPRIDEKQPRWLHLRIRPSSLPFLDPARSQGYKKINGHWERKAGDSRVVEEGEKVDQLLNHHLNHLLGQLLLFLNSLSPLVIWMILNWGEWQALLLMSYFFEGRFLFTTPPLPKYLNLWRW